MWTTNQTAEMKTDADIKRDIARMGSIETIPTDLLVPHYLIHSYLYYELDHSVIADHEYDKLARRIDEEWETIEHLHRSVITRTNLRTTGCGLSYPLRAVGAAKLIYELTKQESYLTRKEQMPINARSKGQRGEREIIDLLQPHVNEVSEYNQVEPPLLQRNQMQSHKGGFDIVGLPGFALEVKRVETEQPGQIAKWWDQAKRQAGKDLEPVLLYRTNKRPWKVRVFSRLELGDGRRYKIPSDIHMDHFIFWMKSRLHCHQVAEKQNN